MIDISTIEILAKVKKFPGKFPDSISGEETLAVSDMTTQLGIFRLSQLIIIIVTISGL